ncbi:hypothetical protein ACP275_05G129100 [Erythranthe tilingii]
MGRRIVENELGEQSGSLLLELEQQTNWDGRRLVKYDDFLYPFTIFRPILSAKKYFKAKETDIILSSIPKSGMTWLMALAFKTLTFSIANRDIYPDIGQSPLHTCNPHTLVPFLEYYLYLNQENPNLENLSDPRIFSTHTPFNVLPDQVRKITSKCKIIYICRSPLDQFVSYRHFSLENKLGKDAVPLELDEAFDMFCDGVYPFDPFWDNILGYWKAHLENPKKVLFLKYEDLKDDIIFNVKKIADFIGCPFPLEEEEGGVVEEISRVCSFESLKNVDKNGTVVDGLFKNSSFFRKGQVGDWTNYLTLAMAERIEKLVQNKFDSSGLDFKISNKV